MQEPRDTSVRSFNLSNRVRLPAHYYIDIGNICNLRCPFCVTGAGHSDQPKTLMRAADYSVILDRIKHVAKLISLYNWGEPLMNPEVLSIIRLTAAAGVRSHIDTNLSVQDLDSAAAEELVLSGLSSLFVSIDGTTQAAYQIYRVRGRLDRVMANLNLLVATKRRLRSAYPFLGWQFHVHRFNEDEINAARHISEQIGVPIVFKRLSTPDKDWKSSYHDVDDMFIGEKAWFQQVYNPPGNISLEGARFHPAILPPCHQLFETMVIEASGDVYPCTVVAGRRYAMGNLLRETLDDIWNGEQFQESRRFIRNYGPHQGGPSICENNRCALNQKSTTSASA